MADFLLNVDTDNGPKEPIPVTLVSGSNEVALAKGVQPSSASQSVAPASDALFTTYSRAATTIATAQVPVTTSATLLVAARPNRDRVQIIVTAATATAIGNAGVTLTTGFPLPATANTSMTLYTTAAIYAVGAANVTIGVVDYYSG